MEEISNKEGSDRVVKSTPPHTQGQHPQLHKDQQGLIPFKSPSHLVNTVTQLLKNRKLWQLTQMVSIKCRDSVALFG